MVKVGRSFCWGQNRQLPIVSDFFHQWSWETLSKKNLWKKILQRTYWNVLHWKIACGKCNICAKTRGRKRRKSSESWIDAPGQPLTRLLAPRNFSNSLTGRQCGVLNTSPWFNLHEMNAQGLAVHKTRNCVDAQCEVNSFLSHWGFCIKIHKVSFELHAGTKQKPNKIKNRQLWLPSV